jgi:hypothetical protein
MTMGQASTGSALADVIASARRLGVELDEDEATRWVAALEAESLGGDLVVDVDSGVYGHRVSMLDFSSRDIARFRAIGDVVGMPDRLPVVRTALALSGSAAQSKVNTFPGDCDFFERVHIVAPTRAEACAILGAEMRAKALATRNGPTFRLWEVKLGTWPFDATRAGGPVRAGSPISWSPAEIGAGRIEALREGETVAITWDDAAAEPGWCKLDWIVADPARRALANASNVLDVTWEAPDGTVTSLDGAIDPYFQEVYLETESLPLVRRLVHELSSDSVDDYVEQLRHEVVKYASHDPNWGKVARRLYNIFRLTGRYPEAVYLRELFDEPTTILYQVAALVRTLDDADTPGGTFDPEMLVAQADQLIISAVQALEGRQEADIVRSLNAVRDNLLARGGAEDRDSDVAIVTDEALRAVNQYFERRLAEVPSIRAYVDELVASANA